MRFGYVTEKHENLIKEDIRESEETVKMLFKTRNYVHQYDARTEI